MNSSDAPSPVQAPRQRRLWQYFLQFRLRTLLALVTLAAIVCWWIVTPKTVEEYVASDRLLLRRHVRDYENSPPRDRAALFSYPTRWNNIHHWPLASVGAWQLRVSPAAGGQVLVQGQCDRNEPHGHWTLYHANGRLAAEGTMFRGAKTGVWRTWSAEGQLLSELTYRLREVQYPVGRMAGMGSMPGSLGGAIGSVPQPLAHTQYYSSRHGPAKAWDANGRPKLEGHYQDDERHGPWKLFDDEGYLAGEGEYQHGRRLGTWKIRDASTGAYQEVVYPADRSR